MLFLQSTAVFAVTLSKQKEILPIRATIRSLPFDRQHLFRILQVVAFSYSIRRDRHLKLVQYIRVEVKSIEEIPTTDGRPLDRNSRALFLMPKTAFVTNLRP